jgi:hypothetical protein
MSCCGHNHNHEEHQTKTGKKGSTNLLAGQAHEHQTDESADSPSLQKGGQENGRPSTVHAAMVPIPIAERNGLHFSQPIAHARNWMQPVFLSLGILILLGGLVALAGGVRSPVLISLGLAAGFLLMFTLHGGAGRHR